MRSSFPSYRKVDKTVATTPKECLAASDLHVAGGIAVSYLLRLLLVVFLAGTAMQCALAWRFLGMRADTTDPESAVVYLGIKASQTGRLYVPISAPPYTPAVYGPLLH